MKHRSFITVVAIFALLEVSFVQGSETPRLFKSTQYPPKTSEERALWDWWHKSEKEDRYFEWKMPILFFGRIVDQLGDPVIGADICFEWSVVGGVQTGLTKSTGDGRFAIEGITGKRLVLTISKSRYIPTLKSQGSFEYAAFFDELFYTPDKNRPVMFTLKKLIAPEPMLKFDAAFRMPISETAWLDVEHGKFGLSGDIAFSVATELNQNVNTTKLSIMLRTEEGSGIVVSTDEFLDHAPKEGYRDNLKVFADENKTMTARMYIMTRSRKFAAVDFRAIFIPRRNEVTLDALIYHNPSGSANLEFDQTKWLNR